MVRTSSKFTLHTYYSQKKHEEIRNVGSLGNHSSILQNFNQTVASFVKVNK